MMRKMVMLAVGGLFAVGLVYGLAYVFDDDCEPAIEPQYLAQCGPSAPCAAPYTCMTIGSKARCLLQCEPGDCPCGFQCDLQGSSSVGLCLMDRANILKSLQNMRPATKN